MQSSCRRPFRSGARAVRPRHRSPGCEPVIIADAARSGQPILSNRKNDRPQVQYFFVNPDHTARRRSEECRKNFDNGMARRGYGREFGAIRVPHGDAVSQTPPDDGLFLSLLELVGRSLTLCMTACCVHLPRLAAASNQPGRASDFRPRIAPNADGGQPPAIRRTRSWIA